MKDYIIKANVYEIQALLYCILGELILHLGTWKWLGGLSIGYGILVFISCIFIVGKGVKEDKSTPNN